LQRSSRRRRAQILWLPSMISPKRW
jgi:hypothetical protein